MIVPKHQNSAPLTIQLASNDQVKALIERVLDCAMIEQDGDLDGARAFITLIDAVAGEQDGDIRQMIALEATAAIFARTGAFYTAVKSFAAGARAEYLTARVTTRTWERTKRARTI